MGMKIVRFSLAVLLFISQLCSVYSQSDMKSSLTFVIDITGSMTDDIDAVKQNANEIFDTVVNSNTSHIEDFVLVIFGDPEIQHLKTTKDRDEFKRTLAAISLFGGGDCPELAMGGVEMALRLSRPGSDLYVFTDASAKDSGKYEVVKQLAGEKGCKIVFILTGECSTNDRDNLGKAYYSLADDTKGEVFNLYKSEVGVILNYVKQTTKARQSVITKQKFPPGSHSFNYTVDSNMKELVVAVTGKNPKVNLIDPEGETAETEEIVRTSRIAIVKVAEVKPGVYKAEVSSDTPTTVTISGTSTIHFEHGFSRLEPISIEETASRPLPDEESYLSIKFSAEGGVVQLQSVLIYDLDQNLIAEFFLRLINRKNQLYVTEPFIPPNKAFRIAIKGYDVLSKSVMTRFALTPIEPQDSKKVTTTNKAPIVTILGKSTVNVDYEDSVELRCKISGYPKPTVVWEDSEGTVSSSNETQIEIPYDYVSVTVVDNVVKNNTYKCKASNDQGKSSNEIKVKTMRTKYFDVLERPIDTVVEYDREARFVCKISAAPVPAKIQWYRQKTRIRNNQNFQLSSDKSNLTIKSMQPHLDGNFICIAKNNINKQRFKFKVSTSGVEKPKIDKTINEVRVREGSNTNVTCRLIQGKPKPTIRWFFRHQFSEKLEQIKGGETIAIKKVGLRHAGTYRCEAFNAAGEDFHYNDVIVEYPPNIVTNSTNTITAIEGETINMPCKVFGQPEPEVKWFLNGEEIKRTKHYHFHKSHTISFEATTDKRGSYTCEAVNGLGTTASQPVLVNIIVPVMIDPPKESTQEVPVGGNLTLPCLADSDPMPNIKWEFHNVNFKTPAKIEKSLDDKGSLVLSRIQVNQEGFYTCIASNGGSSANITYDIKVVAPPSIVSIVSGSKSAVVGDLALRIRCRTTGSPKPTITWMKDGYNIASGSDWYDVEEDGTLLVKEVKKDSEGSYVCEAKNSLGSDKETYDLYVENCPPPGPTTSTVMIEEGKSSFVTCDVTHGKTDLLRWYKGEKLISSGPLTLKNVKVSDSGPYTCRVSTLSKSRSGHTYVKIGFKPRFVYNADTLVYNIEFEDGVAAVMDCTAHGEPTPEVTWWHDSSKINDTRQTYSFDMKIHKRGIYFCLVKNVYGHIVRSFEISSKECSLNIESDFEGNQPLIASTDLKWPSFEVIDGYARIPSKENIVLICADEFENFGRSEIVATCDQGNNFTVDGDVFKYSYLKCNEGLEPIVVETEEPCLPGSTETTWAIKIGYEVRDEFLEVYEVCLDRYRMPIYAKHKMHRSLADADVKTEKWFDSELVPYDFDDLYDCEFQIGRISSLMQRWFHRDDKCCFSKRQLVNPRDVPPGMAQLATYSHLNVVPHWSTCDSKNWEIIERRVRKLVKSTNNTLLVWTGTSQRLKMKGTRYVEDIKISDQNNEKQQVPQFLWKVIQDFATRASLAIIQVNVPDLKPLEAYHHVRCRDICNDVKWMKSNSWRKVKRGYTYCCSIKDFEHAFGFDGLFNRGLENILHDFA